MSERLLLLYILEADGITPRLQVADGNLSEADLRFMERELEPLYPKLCTGFISFVEIKRKLQDLPRPARFRVHVRNDSGERNPDLELEYIPSLAMKSRGAQGWSKELLASLKHFAGEAAGHEGKDIDREAVESAIRELEALAVRAPEQLAPVLLCGFICYARTVNLARAARIQQHYDKARAAIEAALPPALEEAIETPEDAGGVVSRILRLFHAKNRSAPE